MRITVIDGDVTLVAADALVAAINSGGHAAGGVDRAICRRNTHYHTALQEAIERQPLRELETFLATAPDPTRLAFGDIVFVIDDLKRDLRHVVQAGLLAAHAAQKKRVCMPVFRSGVMLGQRETSISQIVREYDAGIRMVRDTRRLAIEELTIVAFQDPDAVGLLRQKLGIA